MRLAFASRSRLARRSSGNFNEMDRIYPYGNTRPISWAIPGVLRVIETEN
jgi:hypothetical protein